jgi:hypothetical protein
VLERRRRVAPRAADVRERRKVVDDVGRGGRDRRARRARVEQIRGDAAVAGAR